MKTLKIFDKTNSALHCKYLLYAEEEPTVLPHRTDRYLELFRADAKVPYKIAIIIQIIEGNNSSYEGKLLKNFESEIVALDTALNWLEFEWDGKL